MPEVSSAMLTEAADTMRDARLLLDEYMKQNRKLKQEINDLVSCHYPCAECMKRNLSELLRG